MVRGSNSALTVANPWFFDELAEDFRLQPRSPLRNMGNTPFPLPSVDQDGKPRIVESVPSSGRMKFRITY